MAEAEVIAGASQRTTMRTVPIKTADQQPHAMLFRTRELLIGQRAQLANALRGHLAEHGHLAPIGLGSVIRLSAILAQAGNDLPDLVHDLGHLHLEQIAHLTKRIEALDVPVADEANRHRYTLAPHAWHRSGRCHGDRNVRTWQLPSAGATSQPGSGLSPAKTPAAASAGRTSRMGQRDIRR